LKLYTKTECSVLHAARLHSVSISTRRQEKSQVEVAVQQPTTPGGVSDSDALTFRSTWTASVPANKQGHTHTGHECRPACRVLSASLQPSSLVRKPPLLIIGGAFASDVSLALLDWTNLGILSHLTFPQPDRLKRTPVQFTPLKVGPKKPTLPMKNLRVAEGWGSNRAQCARAAPLSVRRSKEIFCKPSRPIKKIFCLSLRARAGDGKRD